jgi:hypothetical protein
MDSESALFIRNSHAKRSNKLNVQVPHIQRIAHCNRLLRHYAVTGKVTCLVGNGFGVEKGVGQGYILFSADEASPGEKTIKVPQWYGVSEIDLVRAANGNLVAACRTYRPDRFGREIDHFARLSILSTAGSTHHVSQVYTC